MVSGHLESRSQVPGPGTPCGKMLCLSRGAVALPMGSSPPAWALSNPHRTASPQGSQASPPSLPPAHRLPLHRQNPWANLPEPVQAVLALVGVALGHNTIPEELRGDPQSPRPTEMRNCVLFPPAWSPCSARPGLGHGPKPFAVPQLHVCRNHRGEPSPAAPHAPHYPPH